MIFFKAKEITDLVVKQAEKEKECLRIAKYMVECCLYESRKDSVSEFIKLKGMIKDIDYLRDQIVDSLHGGALIPGLRGNIFMLVNNLNMLAIKTIECGSMFVDQRPTIPDNLKNTLVRMLHYATDISEPLDSSITGLIKGYHKKNIIREHIQEIRKSFMQVCAIKFDLIREISSLPEDQVNKVQLYQCLDCVKAISEGAVGITENIETILLKFG